MHEKVRGKSGGKKFAAECCYVGEMLPNSAELPCMLFLKGNEMHGTVPGTKGIGLVVTSKRNSLYHYRPGSYTDRLIIA